MDLINFLFPRKCLECKRDGKYICDNCIQKVRVGGNFNNENFKIYSVFRYEGAIRKAIISLKYKFATDISEELTNLIVKKIKEINYFKGNNFTLVPIPLHKQRHNWRGFNQTEVIGEKIAIKMKWKYSNDLLIRSKKTNPQVELRGVERKENLSNAFSIKSNNSISKNNKIIIFDDVYTTGSTIEGAKKALKEAGFNKIFCLIIAK